MKDLHDFKVVLLGIIYDPEKKKILIARRDNDPYISDLEWMFPGGRLNKGEDLGKSFKKIILDSTGFEVGNLGSIFTRIADERENLVLAYFLCEIRKGELKSSEKFKELKWVNPEELEKYFTTSFHPRLKEYILNLK